LQLRLKRQFAEQRCCSGAVCEIVKRQATKNFASGFPSCAGACPERSRRVALVVQRFAVLSWNCTTTWDSPCLTQRAIMKS